MTTTPPVGGQLIKDLLTTNFPITQTVPTLLTVSPGSPYIPGHYVTIVVRVPVGTVSGGGSGGSGYNSNGPLYETQLVQVYVPAQPAVPPQVQYGQYTFTTDNIQVNFNQGWNAGARSVGESTGSFAVDFTTTSTSKGVVVGLTSGPQSTDYTTFAYAWRCGAGSAFVTERGVPKSAPVPYADDTLLRVQRRGAVVSYYANDTLVYTSTVPSSPNTTLYAVSSLYFGGDQVKAIGFSQVLYGQSGASLHTAPALLTAYAGHYAVAALHAEAPTLTASAGAHGTAALRTQSAGLVAADHAYAAGRLVAAHPTVSGYAVYATPNYGIGALLAAPATGGGVVLVGGLLDGNLVARAPGVIGADHPYAEATLAMRPASLLAGQTPPIHAYVQANLPSPYRTLFGQWAAMSTLRALLPGGYALNASATVRAPAGMQATYTRAVTLRAFAGGTAVGTLPMGSVAISGTVANIGRLAATLPMGTFTAHGFGGASGAAVTTLSQRPSLRAFSGAVLSVTLSDGYVLRTGGTVGSTGRLIATLPAFELVAASGTNVRGGVLDAVLPALIAVPSGSIDVTLAGSYTLEAIGTAVVAVAYEGYAINLRPPGMGTPQEDVHAVTYIDGFPFMQIIRFGTDYYGVAQDGLYLLGGDTDNGAAIPWYAQTAQTDFGETALKRVSSVTVGGNVTTDIIATVTAEPPELPGTRVDYDYVTQRTSAAQNARVNTGKGLRSRYYSFGLSDDVGNMAVIDTLDIEVDVLKRSR